MTTTLEKLESLELQSADELEQLLTDEVNGVSRDPHEARSIMTAAGVSPKDFGAMVEARRQRLADAAFVAQAQSTIADAIEQEQKRGELIAERDAKIQAIRSDYARKLAGMETAIAQAQTVEAKRRQFIKRLIATCPPALLQEEMDLAERIRKQQSAIAHARDRVNQRAYDVQNLEGRVTKTPTGGPHREKAEAELEAANNRLADARNELAHLMEERDELTRRMDDLQARKLQA